MSIYDPDPQATSYVIAPHDPLQAVYEATVAMNYLHPWLPRQLPRLVRTTGFEAGQVHSYGPLVTKDEAGGLSFFDGLVDDAAGAGLVGAELAAALKGEARRRIAAGTFMCSGANMSVIAHELALSQRECKMAQYRGRRQPAVLPGSDSIRPTYLPVVSARH